MNNDIERVLYSQDDIKAACQRLGAQLTEDYAGKRPLVIGVLKGVIFFMTDLLREMDLMADLDFIDVSSYHGGTASTGEVTLEQDISTDIKDRDVIIVEDILDSGRTLAYLKDFLEARQPRSFKVCTLLDKPEGRVVEARADYVGFNVPNEFLVGYGLDYQEFYRNLPYVGILKPEVYANK
ncbi:hypoxanthine phosphoribosyltransferase [Secundilactobacillus paracollinoides]|uniref:Hypoxanthine phosphoribosyltransferase n=1 Tax=Secundilactobacillus paracollinoides TaxID=240427 RepID=A0A1B2IUQ7_9LACO|nr:hypoxanthine phosphoribosyltransferase [Secundilactobacillus paracollinoides]ANZ59969.1 hypoxanthine phosphoribosyltransferase [Secundilactobacillus paracollinoides]ANZ63076.1 hypoxanthine phosphoribosyltransferase [Secundilactobacillus paracollinoides]ANZ65761.1 hypoxanthine phosphoribosyltransferase [Secundilactobacillus paracollinoides]KRL76851.1 hypoxanthine-guanine phosphoribosyltransferase [Secundilactobacillus paracollinoides DSM 15502 = JCM 11969]